MQMGKYYNKIQPFDPLIRYGSECIMTRNRLVLPIVNDQENDP